jgi:predicted PolB exonuclease-like 3'-5' exonuclease
MNHDEERIRVAKAESLTNLTAAEHSWDVYARITSCKELQTRHNKPYLQVELTDIFTTMPAKVWSENKGAFERLKVAEQGEVFKLRGQVQDYQGTLSLVIREARPVDPSTDSDFDPSQLSDPALDRVEDLVCRTLVVDIETVPCVERRQLPPTVAEALSKHAHRKEMEPDAVMGMSPFFGKVVSIAVGDGDDEDAEVTVLAVPPDGADTEAPPAWLRFMDERELLASFWALAGQADVVVTFNGRGFDVPFLITRSLIHGIPARRDLMSGRFQLKPHLDLWELLSARGLGPSNLDVVCWALGIESPKEVMDGSMVAPAYNRGEIRKIAEYNRHDVRATAAVFRKVRDSILCFRRDWS